MAGAAAAQTSPPDTDAGQTQGYPQNLPPALAGALRAARLPASAVALAVQEVSSTKPSLVLNPDRPMNPASVMKLVTTYAGLELLGPSFVWKTGDRKSVV